MRRVGAFALSAIVAAGLSSPVLARNGAWYAGGDFGGTIIEDEVYNGPYVGWEFGGFSSGVVAMSGVAGYTWSGLAATNLIFGVEGTLGLQLPTNSFEVWGWGRTGIPLNTNMWAYGTGGLGIVGGTLAYGVGGGTQLALGNGIALDLKAVARAPAGSLPTEVGVLAGLDFSIGSAPANTIGGAVRAPSVDGLFDAPKLEGGGSLGVVPSTGAIVPGGSMQLLFPSGNGIDVGLRGSVGVQVPSGVAELFGGGQIGYTPSDKYGFYAFSDLGVIGATPANAFGVGASFQLGPQWSVKPELFGRGAVGSITEGGVKVGMYYDFFGSTGTPSDRVN